MRFATLLLFLIGITVPPPARGQLHLPGMVQVDDSTYIDVKEVSVAEWIANGFWMETRRPVDEVLPQLPYRHFFMGLTNPVRYGSVKKVRTRWSLLVLKIDADSLRTREQRYRAQQLLNYPIVGITYFQAWCYCQEQNERYHEERGSELDPEGLGTGPEVIFDLPDPDLLERLLGTRDSTNGECALFNYACEPCQHAPSGRDAFIHPGREVTPVHGYGPDRRGLYNLRGNAAEMTSAPGVAKGGSYAHPAKDALPGVVQRYEAPQPWLGFRCIARVRRR
jgi:hypothetical protein